ncbi:LysR substrate-binding domain-containing protein [Pseudomonas sp. SG20052]|uniref:LysR substrate-binding domain-containing protein n=1 Tax=Pseudomonas sp. SG20052 TaxID=3074147 RepID=UPI00287F9017|nr:LysR substrate-binding domain-containing protein [Pseudomonas sp. SG20052]WNF58767.1 LysR substrate-binding domain-containing protein [Pseudomonas sp. SG20052]
MTSDLQPFASGLIGHVTFFANNNAISSYLPDDLGRFFSLYPNVRISLEERLSHDIISAVSSGRADIGVVAMETEHPELDFFPYRQDQLVLLAPLNGRFDDRHSVSFAECLGLPFISLQSGAALHTFLMNHASALGGRLDVRVQVSGFRAIARLVSSGAGIGVAPRSALEPADLDRLKVIEILEGWARRNLQVCVQRHPREQNVFRDHLIKILCPP